MEAAKLELAAYSDTLTELINKIGKFGFFLIFSKYEIHKSLLVFRSDERGVLGGFNASFRAKVATNEQAALARFIIVMATQNFLLLR